jgi:UDP-N-acetylmuramoyl-L-alanyl-D-glutamate--2,6-diaminopimelate ligase
VEILIHETVIPAQKHTTPDPLIINMHLAAMRDAGGLLFYGSEQPSRRNVLPDSFAGGVFTNLTHDHLDYHNSFTRDAWASDF